MTCRTTLGEELTLTLVDESMENKSGLCTKVLLDMQKFLVCLLMMEIRVVGSGNAPLHSLSAEQVSQIKMVLANSSASTPRCTLLLRSCGRLKTAVEIVHFDSFKIFKRCLLGFSRVGLTGLGASKRPSANEPMTFGRTLWATAMDVSKHAMTEQKAKSECKVISEKVESLISALPSAKATSPMLTMLQKQICSCIPAVDAVNLALVSKDEEAVANAQVLRGILDKLRGALGEFHEKEAGVEQVSKEIASLWLNTDNIKLQLSASSLECFFKSTVAGQVHFG